MFEKVIAVIKSHKIKLVVAVSLIAVALVVDFYFYGSTRTLTLPNGVKVILTEDSCKLPNVLDAVLPQYKAQLKAGKAELGPKFNNEVRQLCYLELNGIVMGMDETDVQFQFDASEFK